MKILTRKEIIEFIKDAEKNGRVELYDSIGGTDKDIYDGYKSYEAWQEDNKEEFINLFGEYIYDLYNTYLNAIDVLQIMDSEEDMKKFNYGEEVKKTEYNHSIGYSFKNKFEVYIDNETKQVEIRKMVIHSTLWYTFTFDKNNVLQAIKEEWNEDVLTEAKFYKKS